MEGKSPLDCPWLPLAAWGGPEPALLPWPGEPTAWFFVFE